MENNKNEAIKEIKGWKDIIFNENLAIVDLINLMNTFNQRLALLEDNVFIRDENGNMISVTKYIEFSNEQIQKEQEELKNSNN